MLLPALLWDVLYSMEVAPVDNFANGAGPDAGIRFFNSTSPGWLSSCGDG